MVVDGKKGGWMCLQRVRCVLWYPWIGFGCRTTVFVVLVAVVMRKLTTKMKWYGSHCGHVCDIQMDVSRASICCSNSHLKVICVGA